MSTIYTDATKRHDFVYLFDATDSNPNGDPDAGNLPRMDPETLQGLVTDVCIKRKIRDYVDMVRGTEDRYKIYVQNRGIALNELHARAYTARNLVSTGSRQKREDVEQARSWMCENFFDIRLFGAVMNTQVNCGQVRGPIQLTFSRSIDPIVPLDLAITRVAVTQVGADKQTEIGRKAIVPYGLYLGYGYYIPHFAQQTGFIQEDLEVFWEALQKMWDFDRAAGRSNVALRGLHVFSHHNPLGNAPAHQLFERVIVKPNTKVPRRITDYSITLVETDMPDGVTLTRLVG